MRVGRRGCGPGSSLGRWGWGPESSLGPVRPAGLSAVSVRPFRGPSFLRRFSGTPPARKGLAVLPPRVWREWELIQTVARVVPDSETVNFCSRLYKACEALRFLPTTPFESSRPPPSSRRSRGETQRRTLSESPHQDRVFVPSTRTGPFRSARGRKFVSGDFPVFSRVDRSGPAVLLSPAAPSFLCRSGEDLRSVQSSRWQ